MKDMIMLKLLLKKKIGKHRIKETNLGQLVFLLLKLDRHGSAFLCALKVNSNVLIVLEKLDRQLKDVRISNKRTCLDGIQLVRLTNLCINQERMLNTSIKMEDKLLFKILKSV